MKDKVQKQLWSEEMATAYKMHISSFALKTKTEGNQQLCNVINGSNQSNENTKQDKSKSSFVCFFLFIFLIYLFTFIYLSKENLTDKLLVLSQAPVRRGQPVRLPERNC